MWNLERDGFEVGTERCNYVTEVTVRVGVYSSRNVIRNSKVVGVIFGNGMH